MCPAWKKHTRVYNDLIMIWTWECTTFCVDKANTCGYVKSRVAITLVRSTHCCLSGSRVPECRISVQQPQWEDGEGLNLFR